MVFPPGYDSLKTYYDESTSTLYYDRVKCTNGDWVGAWNIYKVVIPLI